MGEVGGRERADRGRSFLAPAIAEMLIIGYPARMAARIPDALRRSDRREVLAMRIGRGAPGQPTGTDVLCTRDQSETLVSGTRPGGSGESSSSTSRRC